MSDSIVNFNFEIADLIHCGRTTIGKISQIKHWLNLASSIPKMSDEQIGVFLTACNNDIEATKNCIVAYFKHRAAAPEIFTNRNLSREDLTLAINTGRVAILPKRTRENYVVIIGSLKDTAYSNFYLEAHCKLLFIILEAIMYNNLPDGIVIIVNVKGVGLMHLTRLKIGIIRKFFQYLQEALPLKLKRIHVLNTSYVFEKAMAIVKPFMHSEIYDMIITHPPNENMEVFFEKYIPADKMPSDYGGTLPNMEELNNETISMCKNLKPFLDQLEKQVQIYCGNI